MSRSELSTKLGHKKISDQLYKIVRDLMADQMIEYTLPEKPRSPRQKYQLTDKGRTELANVVSTRLLVDAIEKGRLNRAVFESLQAHHNEHGLIVLGIHDAN